MTTQSWWGFPLLCINLDDLNDKAASATFLFHKADEHVHTSWFVCTYSRNVAPYQIILKVMWRLNVLKCHDNEYSDYTIQFWRYDTGYMIPRDVRITRPMIWSLIKGFQGLFVHISSVTTLFWLSSQNKYVIRDNYIDKWTITNPKLI